MADSRHLDLPYGSFGHANYDPEHRNWSFERSEDSSNKIHILGGPKLLAGITTHAGSPPVSRSTQPSLRRPPEIQALVKHYPDIQPAIGLLSAHLRLSEAVQSATARHDPQKGNLLDFGSVVSEASGHAITIAAFPCGLTGNDLRLIHVQSQKRGWADTKSAWLEVPTIHGEEAMWSGPGTAIQQVCFAKATERTDTFLAVRMLTKTLLFRPILRKAPRFSSGASRLDANFCVEIQLSAPSFLPHADVSFNPWYTRQCAVVDQAGNWEVWEFEDRRTSTVKRLSWYRPPPTGSSGGTSKALFDGWARVTWVANLFTIAMASRKTVGMHNIAEGGEVTNAKYLLDLYGTDSWILDLTILPSRPVYLCVLTSTHLLLYYIDDSSPEAVTFWTAARVKHFRSPNDVTLRLSAFLLADRVVVLLRSDLDPIVAVYTIILDHPDGVHIMVPSELRLESGAGVHRSVPAIAGFCIKDVAFGTRPMTKHDCVALRLRDSGVTFAALTVLSKDLTLEQIILYTQTPVQSRQIPMLAWENRPGVSTTKLRKDAFVVNDDEDLIEAGETMEQPVSAFARRKLLATSTRTGREWTLPFEGVADAVQTPASSELTSIVEVIDDAETHIRKKQDEAALPWRVLTDLTTTELVLPDMEAAQSRLEMLLGGTASDRNVPPEEATEASHIPPLEVARITREDRGTVADVHAAIVRDWITPLPSGVTGRVRLANEQLARRMAAEVVLAAHILRTPHEQPQNEQAETQPTQESFDIPVRAGPSSAALPQSSQVASQATVLPTPSPSATPSLMTASSHPSSFAAMDVGRLSKYTTMTTPPTTSLPRSLTNVLSHWTIGTNPADYDWRSTSKKLAQHNDEEQTDEHMTEKERLRVQRRAERHIKRQRREAAVSQAQQAASSQAPEIFSASQPVHVQRKVESQPSGVAASSQSVPFGGQGASQVVSGRFGGRPPPRKKRKQGF